MLITGDSKGQAEEYGYHQSTALRQHPENLQMEQSALIEAM
jgi:hypothetical protein